MSANETLDPITSLRRAVARVASNTGLRDRARIDAAMARVERALSDSIAAVRERDAEIARLNKAASAWREYAEHLEHCPWCADDGVAECDRGGRELREAALGEALSQTGTEPPQPAEGV